MASIHFERRMYLSLERPGGISRCGSQLIFQYSYQCVLGFWYFWDSWAGGICVAIARKRILFHNLPWCFDGLSLMESFGVVCGND
jgi:hypothetical protein